MGWLTSAASEFGIAVSDVTVWLSIGQALLFGGGLPAVRHLGGTDVGLLGSDAPAGETLGVGLASGLLVRGRLVGGDRIGWTQFLHAGGGRVRRRDRPGPGPVEATCRGSEASRRRRPTTPTRRTCPRRRTARASIVAVLAGGLFIVAVALLYGSTMVLSPRDGVQPVEFADEAFYSVLGADLAKTGTEIDLSAVRLLGHRGTAGPDLVPLGRDVARGRRHHDLRRRRRSTPATSSSCPSCCWPRPR